MRQNYTMRQEETLQKVVRQNDARRSKIIHFIQANYDRKIETTGTNWDKWTL